MAFEPNETATEAELVEQLRELLNEAVVLHQVSDVPVGAFLSGGIDSSAIVAMMAKPAAGRLKTFSIGFAEAGFDELAHARAVAAQFGTDHHDVVLRPDVVQIVEDLTWYLDEPFGDTSAIPTYMVSKLAAEHVKVVLSGDGGDELFAGYDKYVVEGRERALRPAAASGQEAGRRGRIDHAARHARPPLPAAPCARRAEPVPRRVDAVSFRRDAESLPARGARARGAARPVGVRRFGPGRPRDATGSRPSSTAI